ncbi:MAG: RIP metalloprotease RseP [Burkholderiales bacterium]|nr:RIP metalloprotease RseP [Burkholderiales bacterium]
MLTVAAFLLALVVLIVFHEYGHYLAARLCGVKVLRFSVGFGKPLLLKQFTPGGTEWVVASIPLGGFVKMLGEQDDKVAPEESVFAFNRQSLAKRFFIVAAGPLANFLLAILLYWGLFVSGMPGQRAILELPAAGTAAARAGIERWETIEKIDGVPTATWEEVNWRLAQKIVEGGAVELTLRNAQDQARVKQLNLDAVTGDDLDRDFLSKLGLAPAKHVQARLGKVLPESPAALAGLQAGDIVRAIDGKPIGDWNGFTEQIRAKPGQRVRLEVTREGRTLPLAVTPKREQVGGKEIGRIGVAPDVLVMVQYPLGQALSHALAKCWDTSVFSLQMLGRMITGDVSWRNLSGPLTIAQVAGETAHIGWLPYLIFIALVSISLGVINLLPVPILDGGHLMYYIVEFIKGSPVSSQAMDIGQRVGIAVLVLLMSVALYNDIVRQFGP